MADSVRFMARYHVAATKRLVECIPNEQAASKVLPCLFFDTIHATLNHIAGVDRLWRLRLSGQSSAEFNELYTNNPDVSGKRDGELWHARCPDWATAKQQAVEAAEETCRFIHDRTAEELSEIVKFKRTDDVEASIMMGPGLLHLLNHATHHRGQVHAALTELGYRSLGLDIPVVMGFDQCQF
jgi:uncharacterized damage-inducible protein DinB